MRKSILLVAIPLGLAFYFVYAGILWNLVVSFTDWRGLCPTYSFSSFFQYESLLGDPVFWVSLKNNLILFSIVPASIGLGLFLATLLDRGLRGSSVFRSIYLFPFALSFVVTGTMWAWMYAPSNGILNTLLRSTGLGFLASSWHTTPNMVMPAIILALVWQFSGYTSLILLAGMKSVPRSQILAAKLDRASDFRIYKRVIYPQLKTSIFAAFIVLMIFALKAFDLIWVLTSGGPGYSSYIMPVMMYAETFQKSNFAYGAAIASFLLAIVLAIVVPYVYKSYRD